MCMHPAKTQISLIRVFTVRMKEAWVLSYPLSAQWRLWLDWADAQMPRLIWVFAWRTVTLLVLSCRGWYSVEWAIKLIISINQSCGLVENSRDTERLFDCFGGGLLYSGLEMLFFFFCDAILSALFTKPIWSGPNPYQTTVRTKFGYVNGTFRY